MKQQLFFLGMLSAQMVFAQSTFEKYLRPAEGHFLHQPQAFVCRDGSVLLTGNNYLSTQKTFLMHFSARGEVLQEKYYGGGAVHETGSSFYERADGKFWLLGNRQDYLRKPQERQRQVYLQLLSALGDSLRSISYHGILTGNLYGAPNGDLYFPVDTIGTTAEMEDAFLVKTDSTGKERWRVKFATPDYDRITSITAAGDGTLLLCGYRSKPVYHEADLLMARVDTSGKILWEKSFDLYPERPLIISAVPGTQRWTVSLGKDSTVAPSAGFVSDSTSNRTSEMATGVFIEGKKVVFTATVSEWQKPLSYLRLTLDLEGNELKRELKQSPWPMAAGKKHFITLDTDSTADGKTDLVLRKFSHEGKLIWQQQYGRKEHWERALVKVLADGFLIYGTANTSNSGDTYEMFVIKTDRKGRVKAGK